MLMVKSRCERLSGLLGVPPTQKSRKEANQLTCGPCLQSPPTPPTPPISYGSRDPAEKQAERVCPENPTEKLIHTFTMGSPFHSPSGQVKNIRDISQHISEMWRGWLGLTL